ncbi:MAG: ATP-binding protein [Cyanobium sp.]|nr:ATP-binding protein [Cyanobium sp.]
MERFPIRNEADIGIAIVGAQTHAQSLGFSAAQIHRLGTAVSELASNIIKYACAAGGEILIAAADGEEGLSLTVEARDNGPGIAHLDWALTDHCSSSGSLGLGLPGVKRIVDGFRILSLPGSGTVVTITLRR